jgi:hypothetical protein
MVLHPRRGLLILEVKDWKLDSIRDMDPVSATLDLGSGLKTVSNPLEQARQYAHAVVRAFGHGRGDAAASRDLPR